MADKNYRRGREGERLASLELERRGFLTVARNVRSVSGEVDLIALDGETLVFIEVKNWPIYEIDNLEYSITREKQRRIIETAKYFLCSHREYNERPVRFDVVFLKPGLMRHLKAAFMES
ncbi:MAG: YraN family protein [Treponema sp.]|nr:YraN family protein [Treponema sp.]